MSLFDYWVKDMFLILIFDFFGPRTITLMVHMLEVIPLALHLGVVFQIQVAFGILESQCLINGHHVGYEQGIDTFALVLGTYSNEQ